MRHRADSRRLARCTLRSLLVAVFASVLSACSYKPLVVPQASLPVGAQDAVSAQPVSLTVHARYLQFQNPLGPSIEKTWAKRQYQIREQVDKARWGYPFLQAARWDDASLPNRILVEVTFDTRGKRLMHKISGMTYYIVPAFYEGVVSARGRLFQNGQQTKSFDAEGTYKVRQHILWVLAPFMWRLSTRREVTEATLRALFGQMQQEAPALLSAGAGNP